MRAILFRTSSSNRWNSTRDVRSLLSPDGRVVVEQFYWVLVLIEDDCGSREGGFGRTRRGSHDRFHIPCILLLLDIP